MNVNDAMKSFRNKSFTIEASSDISKGYMNGALWVYVDLNYNDVDYLVVEDPHLDALNMYKFAVMHTDSVITGDLTPFKSRELYFNYFAFRTSTRYCGYMLRIKTNGPMYVPIRVFTSTDFISHLHFHFLYAFLYLGILIMSLFFNILLYLRLKESLYLYYNFNLVGMGVVAFLDVGYLFQWFWPNTPTMNNHVIIMYGFFVFTVFFSFKFLNITYQRHKTTFCIYVFYLFLFLVNGILDLCGLYRLGISVVMFGAFSLPFLYIFTSLNVYRTEKSSTTIIFMCGWGFYSLMTLIFLLSKFGFMPSNAITLNAVSIGNIVEIVVMYAAVIEKINSLKKESERTQALYLQNIEQYNHELEQRVEERTRDLQTKNRELEKLNKTKNFLFSVIAHDLRNPMGVLLSFSELLISKVENIERDKLKKYSHFIRDSATTVFDLLENLLLWTKSQSDALVAKKEEVALKRIIDSVVSLYVQVAASKDITIDKHACSDIKVLADNNLVEIIIRNLVNNAIKFTPKQGTVFVRTTKVEHIVIVSVSDTGVGLTPEQLLAIENGISPASTDGTEHEKGTGLGLQMCFDFAQKCNGQITVKSSLNQGTEFCLYLPAFS
jgi:signal transduction histidine kinase